MNNNKCVRNLLWGILSYYICSNILILYIPRTICAVLDLLCIITILYSFVRAPKRSLNTDLDVKIVYSFFLIWGLGIALRGLLSYNNFLDMRECITSSEAFLTYLLPFIFFLKVDYNLFYYLKKIGFICLLLGLLFFCLNINDLFLHAQEFYAELITSDIEGKYLILGRCGVQSALAFPLFLFYIGGYFRKKEQYFFLACFILSIVTVAYAGRRGGIATLLLYLFAPYFIKLKIKKLFFLLLSISIIYYYGIDYLESTFSVLSNRMFDDTRTWAEMEFYKGMGYTDWLFGKGSTGTFYSPTFGIKRNVIETGYLHLALKGGIFYSIAWIYLLCISFIRGLFAHSQMVRVMAFYIFPFIPGLYIFGHPVLDFSFFILWICIICCNSSKIRNSDINFLKTVNS